MSERTYIPNSFQTPNVLVDDLMPLLTGDEWKVLIFMTRHILGFHDRIASRRHNISLSMFVKGTETYPGCGLGQNAVRTCLEKLSEFNIIKPIGKPGSKGQLWELCFDSPDINWNALQARTNAMLESGKERTAKARSVRHKGSVPHNSSVMSDITPALCPDINNQTQNTTSNTSLSASADVKPKRNEMYDAILSIWGYTAQLNGLMAGVLKGTAKRKGWKEYNLETPVTAAEVLAWSEWYRKTELHGKKDLNMVAELVKVQSSITRWQQLGMPSNGNKPAIRIIPLDDEPTPYPDTADYVNLAGVSNVG